MSYILKQITVLGQISILALILAVIWYVLINSSDFIDNSFKENSTYKEISTHVSYVASKVTSTIGCSLFPTFCTMMDEMKGSVITADMGNSLRKAACTDHDKCLTNCLDDY